MKVFHRKQTSSRCRRSLAGMVAALAVVGGSFVYSAAPAEAQQSGFAYVDAGEKQTCAVKATTAVAYCWGANDFGQATPPWGWTFKQVATGQLMSCGLGGDGVVTCWGQPYLGLSLGRRQQWTVPGTFSFIDISPTAFTGCGILVSGSLKCWDGSNYWTATATADAPGAQPPSGTFISIASGDDFSCGVRTNFTAVCWGIDTGTPLPNTTGTFLQVTRGPTTTCFLRTDRAIACQGDNKFGQAPALISGRFAQVSVGDYHGCGLKTTGAVVCWGAQTYMPGTPKQLFPPNFGQAVAPTGTWKQISAGYLHTCGIRSDDMLVCWGDNSSGQLP